MTYASSKPTYSFPLDTFDTNLPSPRQPHHHPSQWQRLELYHICICSPTSKEGQHYLCHALPSTIPVLLRHRAWHPCAFCVDRRGICLPGPANLTCNHI